MKTQLHSIIIPVYQSMSTLETLVKRIAEAMNNSQINFELILVDDGSQDNSFKEIKRLASIYPFIRGFKLSRNFGHQKAVTIGLRESKGKFVAIIDDDLQDPPEFLPRFFQTLYDGADVVYGIRRKRKESIFKRVLYAAFYRVLSLLSNIYIPMDAGDFCVMKQCVVDAMLQLQDANPFLRGIRSWVGFKQVGIEYKRDERLQGKSGYTFRKYINFAITGILMFSYIPLRLATYFGFLVALSAFFYSVFLVIYWWLYDSFDVPGFLTLIVIITFLGGVQLISIGIIGEYIARLNDNTRKWPIAIVAETTTREQS